MGSSQHPRNSTRVRKIHSAICPSASPPTPPIMGTRRRPLVTRTFAEIRGQLVVALATTNITIATLRAQSADIDTDVALVLRRCVADTLDRLIDKISELLAGARHER
jgi:hypothetical protein